MAALQDASPCVGEEGFIQEPHTLSVVLKCLPKEVRSAGPRKQGIVHTCFDVSDQYLAIGSEQGYVWVLDLHATKLIRELNDFRGTAISVVALNVQQEHVAFGTRDGQTKIESFTKQMSKGYRIQEKDGQTVVAMTWDHTGTTLLCAYTSGKLVKASFQFAGEVMEVVPVLECGSRVVQLSLCGPSLLISTLARSLLLDIDSGRVTQVGTKERKSGSFGGCFSQCSPSEEEDPPVVAFLARPGLRMWTADDSGKVILTTKFRSALSSGQFPRVPTPHWSSGSPPQFDTWQFSSVVPWLQSFVVTYHEHTLCVLDPTTSTVVGVLCLDHEITSAVTSGKFVYVLCSGNSRPLVRFTVHPSYLKSLRKVTTSHVARVDADNTASVEDEGEQVGKLYDDSATAIGPIAEEHMEVDLEDEQDEVTDGIMTEGDLLSMVPRLLTQRNTGGQDSENVEGGTLSVIGEFGTTADLVSEGEQLAASETVAGVITDPGATLPGTTQAKDTPISTSASPDCRIEGDTNVKDPQQNVTLVELSTPPSATSNMTTQSPHNATVANPPSVTGPVGMQDLAREVTDLLRPAFGKLSGFMRSQDRRRKDGGSAGPNSGTATPQESPLADPVREEEGQGERTGTPAVEVSLVPTPKLMLKLGGRLGELMSSDREKERDTLQSPPVGEHSVAVTPTVVSPEEEERRLRMAQAIGEEDAVSERLTQRKRRKRKTKKHSSKPNSTSASLEKLTDIGDVEAGSPVASSQAEPTPDSTQVAVAFGTPQPNNDELTSKLTALVEAEEVLPSRQIAELEEDDHHLPDVKVPQTDLLLVTSETESNTLRPPEAVDGHNKLMDETKTVVSLPDSGGAHPAEDYCIRIAGSPDITDNVPISIDAELDVLEPAHTGHGVVEMYGSPLQQLTRELSSPRGVDKILDSVEVDLGSDPLSQLQSNDEGYFNPRPASSHFLGKTTLGTTKTGSAEGHRQLASGDEATLELSDNPLYGDDTSDFTTDTESSHQRSRRGSSAKLQNSSRGSSVAPSSSTMFAAKHMKSKGAASLGVSNAVSDLSWENSLHVPRQRSERRFTPSASPFEVSNSPAELSSSFHSSCSTALQRQNKGASLPPPSASVPATSNLLHFQEGRRSGGESGSDFSGDENEGGPVEAERFSLCAAAIDESHSNPIETPVPSMKSPSPIAHQVDASFFDEGDQNPEPQEVESSVDPEADIWVTVPHPCRGHVQSICLSDHLLWLVDSRNMVYCTETNTKGKKWELIKHQMQHVSSSPSGSIVWGVYRQNAYVRLGLELTVLGQMWRNVTKNTSLMQKVKYVCADDSGVWVVKNDGQIIFRKGVTPRAPQGRVWVEVGRAAGFTSVASCSGVVWATNTSGRLFYRDGVTEQNPSGRKWVDMKAPPLEAVCLTQGNIAWIIDGEGKMGFRCGVSCNQPMGKNPWWEVTVSTTLSHSSLPFNSLWQVMTSEGSQFLSSVSSLIHTHLPGHHKLLAVSASNRAGVCVLESGSKLHACWRSTTGYHYSSASKDGVFQLTTWTMFGSGSTGLWVVRDDGELYCVTPQDKFVRIECASTVQMMTVSSTALWVISNNQLWSRQGMTSVVPEGISWDYIELSPQLHSNKLKHIVCGKRAVWAVDGTGVPHFRFGVHSREPGTGMSPAWVPVDDHLSHPLHQITVSQNDWLVWACDDNGNSYARTGVTPDFPVGTAWDIIPGQTVKQLCAHGKKVYALTPSGNLLCRYGITETNIQGNYWRQLPGKFVQITVGHGGRLLGLDNKGSILKQQYKTLTVAQDSEFLRHQFEEALDPSWEVV